MPTTPHVGSIGEPTPERGSCPRHIFSPAAGRPWVRPGRSSAPPPRRAACYSAASSARAWPRARSQRLTNCALLILSKACVTSAAPACAHCARSHECAQPDAVCAKPEREDEEARCVSQHGPASALPEPGSAEMKRALHLCFSSYGRVLDVVCLKTSKLRGQARLLGPLEVVLR